MRCGKAAVIALVASTAVVAPAAGHRASAPAAPAAEHLPFSPAPVGTEQKPEPVRVHGQRYSMGTMFDIVVFHASRPDAERAIAAALDEVVRLDGVMSHFRADSDLARLIRDGRRGFVAVDPDLYRVLQQAAAVSALTDGRFDVTVAPLLAVWQRARAEDRQPAADAIDAARRCVGSDKIEARPPDRIRLRADCVDIDLGGIGKGYAVDRALDVLIEAGIRHAVVNGGASSIGAIGAPPRAGGWPVRVGGPDGPEMRLANASMSTSGDAPWQSAAGGASAIIDARSGRPAEGRLALTVVAGDAATADALSTALTLMTIDEGKALLRRAPGVSALWIDGAGAVAASHGELTSQPARAH